MNYQLINKKVIIGEYFKYNQEYFYKYKKNGKYIDSEGKISLRFPNDNKIMVKFDKKGIYYRKSDNFPNVNELKEWKKLINEDIVLKNNEFLVDSYTLNLLLSFTFILDKANFEKNEEYKQISKEYKNVLKIFIFQLNTIKLHCEFIQKACGNEQNNLCFIITN